MYAYRIDTAATGATPDTTSEYGPADLLQAAADAIANGDTPEWHWVEIWYQGSDEHEPEAACVLVLPAAGRVGIAWGADATWADANTVDDAVECWLNRPDEWAARN